MLGASRYHLEVLEYKKNFYTTTVGSVVGSVGFVDIYVLLQLDLI